MYMTYNKLRSLCEKEKWELLPTGRKNTNLRSGKKIEIEYKVKDHDLCAWKISDNQ